MSDKLTCEETFWRLDDFLGRELGEDESVKLREHLDLFVVCTEEFEFEASVWSEVQAKLRRFAGPPGLRNNLMRILRENDCPEPFEI